MFEMWYLGISVVVNCLIMSDVLLLADSVFVRFLVTWIVLISIEESKCFVFVSFYDIILVFCFVQFLVRVEGEWVLVLCL